MKEVDWEELKREAKRSKRAWRLIMNDIRKMRDESIRDLEKTAIEYREVIK